MADEVLAPVPHRQDVCPVPKMLRVDFRKDRRLLGKLCQCAAEALKTRFRAASKDLAAVPGILIAIQTYGDLVTFHPPLHALVTDGVFSPTGGFVAFPQIALYALEYRFRHRVLRMLLWERRSDEALIRKLLGWQHSGSACTMRCASARRIPMGATRWRSPACVRRSRRRSSGTTREPGPSSPGPRCTRS